MNRHWVGIDWGTTHRRAWYFVDGELRARRADDQGVLVAGPHFGASLDALLRRLEAPAEATVVMAGMIGSATGWHEARYLDAGQPLGAWADHLAPVPGRPGCFIVPGCRWQRSDEVDVMRSEETQLLGAWHLDPSDGWYVLPGTHSKWVALRSGCVVELRTYMSGELYALLTRHGTLAPLLPREAGGQGPDVPGDSGFEAGFDAGIQAASARALSHALFGLRARVVTGMVPREQAPGYLSGLLIGSEWHDVARTAALDAPVRIVGTPALAALHAVCARRLGLRAQVLDTEAVQLAAWRALRAGAAR
ncbi:MAG TPA: 2-dehydro-3-deoxygalactonokinase [Burkholderiaceae bacterium]|nr:2-dehydro-3-deoxygalactonokinase [Burkholderiaceae bacterium]